MELRPAIQHVERWTRLFLEDAAVPRTRRPYPVRRPGRGYGRSRFPYVPGGLPDLWPHHAPPPDTNSRGTRGSSGIHRCQELISACIPLEHRDVLKLPPRGQPAQICVRSEEHTSELQSRGHLVCRLLLEKKN